MDLENFDVESATLDAWDAFTANLAEVLSVMDDSSDLTISVAKAMVDGESPAVRFSASGTTLHAHAIPGGSNGAVRTLLALGWTDPGDGPLHVTCDQEDTRPLASLTTATMREAFKVVHPVFLEPDQLKEVLSGDLTLESVPTPKQPGALAVMPTDRADLDRIVDQQLEKIFGHPALRDPQGDVAIRVGSTMLFLRSTTDANEIVLFSPLVHEVAGRSRACEVLNDLNVESRYGRFALHRDRVFVQVAVAAKPFVPAHLRQALSVMSQIADGIDDDLATRLGGRTTFPTSRH